MTIYIGLLGFYKEIFIKIYLAISSSGM